MTLAFGNSVNDRDRFQVLLGNQIEVVLDVQDLHSYLETHPEEDLVVIGPGISMAIATDLAERYRLQRPSLGIVLLRDKVTSDVLGESLRAGIREVVLASDAQELNSACKRSLSLSGMLRGRSDIDSSMGKVILVFGAKGGCGKTTVATNLATALGPLTDRKVCLVDLDVDFGDVAIFLQIPPTKTISDAVHMMGDLDERALRTVISTYNENLDLVLAPTRLADAEFVTPALTMEVIRTLRSMYGFVVIDAPPAFNDITLQCFDEADSYVLVTTLDLPALKNLKVALETLDTLGYPRSKWQVVLNRANTKVGLSIQDVEEILGVAISISIPSSRDVPATLNAGKTLVEDKPKHPVSNAVGQLADLEAGLPRRKGPRRGWRRSRS